MKERYLKFLESRQEPLRLAIALVDFFDESCPEQYRAAYGAYLRRRIRPAAEKLMETEELEKLSALWDMGLISPQLLDSLILEASQKGKTASMVWLMRQKNEKLGFKRPEFEL